MADDIGATIINLVKDTFGTGVWHASSILDKLPVKSDQIGDMCGIAYAIAALMLIIQLVITVLNISKSGGNIWENLGPLIFRTMIMTALISVPLYSLLFRTTITGMTSGIADHITAGFIDEYIGTWQKLTDGSSLAQQSVLGILTSTGSSLVTSIISTIIFVLAIACVFIITQLQPFLWLFAYWVGPICLAFGFCDLTAHVAKNWLNLFLQINFIGVFGSIAFLVAHSAGLASHLSVGADAMHVVLVTIYGLLSIIFFCSIYPLTAYLFSGNSSIGSAATPQGMALAAGGAMGAYGATMALTGKAMQAMGKEGGAMASMGAGMSKHGKSILGKGETVQQVASGRFYKEREPQGSQHTKSSIATNQEPQAPTPKEGQGGGMQGSGQNKPTV